MRGNPNRGGNRYLTGPVRMPVEDIPPESVDITPSPHPLPPLHNKPQTPIISTYTQPPAEPAPHVQGHSAPPVHFAPAPVSGPVDPAPVQGPPIFVVEGEAAPVVQDIEDDGEEPLQSAEDNLEIALEEEKEEKKALTCKDAVECLKQDQWTFCKKRTVLKRHQLISMLMVLLIWFLIIFITLPSDKRPTGNDDFDNQVEPFIYVMAVEFIIYGLTIIKFPQDNYCGAVLAIVMIGAPFVFVCIYVADYIDNPEEMNAAYIVLACWQVFTYLYWLLIKMLRDFCLVVCKNEFFTQLAILACCLLVWSILTVSIAFGILFPYRDGGSHENTTSGIAKFTLLSLILIFWGYIHYRYLYKPKAIFEEREERRENDKEMARIQKVYGGQEITQDKLKQMASLNIIQREGIAGTGVEAIENRRRIQLKKNIVFYGNFFGNLSVGALFILIQFAVCTYLVGNANGSRNDPEKAQIMSGFIFTFIIIFVILFIPITGSSLKQENKQLITAFGFAFLPLFVINASKTEMEDNDAGTALAYVLMTTVPIFGCYMATMSYVRRKGENWYKAMLTITSFCLIYPLYYAFAMYSADFHSSGSFFIIIGLILFFVGLFLVLIFSCYKCITKVKYYRRMKVQFKELHFKDSSICINSFNTVIAFAILWYVFFEKVNKVKDIKSGSILALTGIISLISIFVNVVLRFKIPANLSTHMLFSLFTDNPESDPHEYLPEKRLQKLSGGCCIIIAPICGIVLYFVLPSGYMAYAALSFGIGGAFTAVFFIFMLEIKKKIGIYGHNCFPITLALLWLFIFYPFLVLLPAAVVMYGDDRDTFQQILGTAMAILSILVMTGVSLGAILLNEVFKRIEYEKKAKWCVNYILAKVLKPKAVKGTRNIIRSVFDQTLTLGKEMVKDVLIQELYFSWWAIPDRDPDIRYSKVLIRKNQKNKLLAMQEKKENKRKELGVGDLDEESGDENEDRENNRPIKYRLCCLYCYESDESDADADEESESDIEENYEDIIREPNMEMKQEAAFELIDFGLILQNAVENRGNIVGGNDRGKENPYMKYVDPFNIFEGENVEEFKYEGIGAEEDIDYDAYLDVVEGREVDSDTLMEYIKHKKPCRTRFIDMIFKRFAHGEITAQHPYYWMTHSDFQYFVKQSGIISEEDYDFDEYEIRLQEYDMLFIAATNQNLGEQFNRVMFDQLLIDIARKLQPQKPLSEALEYLVGEVIFLGIYNSMPHFINTDFAKNVVDSTLHIPGLYINDPITNFEEEDGFQTLIPVVTKKRYSCMRRFCIKLNKCVEFVIMLPVRCCMAFGRCIKAMASCCSTSQKTEDEEDEEGMALKSQFKGRNKIEVLQDGTRRYIKHEESPPWEEVVDVLVHGVDEAIYKYEHRAGDEEPRFHMNASNAIIIFNKVVEFYSLASLALAAEVGWNLTTSTEDALLAANMETSNDSNPIYFYVLFFTAFGLSIIYCMMAIPAARLAQKGLLGMDRSGIKAKVCSFPFFFAKSVNLLGCAMYIPILKNLINVFVCDYDLNPAALYRNTDIICWESDHFMFICLGFIGIMVYYPLATFMFANLQFQDKDLDLKYKPTFLIVLAQIKLLLAGISAFWQDNSDIGVRIGAAIICFLWMAVYNHKNQPCMIKKANLIHTISYIALIWIMIGGLLVWTLDWQYEAAGFIIGGLLLISLITFVLYKILYPHSVQEEAALDIDESQDKEELEMKLAERLRGVRLVDELTPMTGQNV